MQPHYLTAYVDLPRQTCQFCWIFFKYLSGESWLISTSVHKIYKWSCAHLHLGAEQPSHTFLLLNRPRQNALKCTLLVGARLHKLPIFQSVVNKGETVFFNTHLLHSDQCRYQSMLIAGCCFFHFLCQKSIENTWHIRSCSWSSITVMDSIYSNAVIIPPCINIEQGD